MINLPLISIISGLLTISVRLSGLMLFAPFFNSVVIPPRVKAILVLAITLLLYPLVGHDLATHTLMEWPLLVFSEFTIGLGMGLATNVVFEAAALAGSILSVQMGYSLINILDPQTQVETTVVSFFYQSIVMLLFLRMDVHYWLVRAVGTSYTYLPAGSLHMSNLFTMAVLKTGSQLFSLGIQIAAPVLSATLAADIVLAMLGKASPQMPLMLLGPAVKSILGVLILVATLKYWPPLFHKLFLDSITNGEHILHLAN